MSGSFALRVLTDLFDEDGSDDETPEQIAALVLRRLRENGIVPAPVELIQGVKVVLRRSIYEKSRGADQTPGSRNPEAVWARIIETLTEETDNGS